MVELKSFPFDSIADDREYPAQIFRNYFHKFLSTGVYFGKYKDYGDYSMKVVTSLGLNVRVTKGAGIIKGLDFELEEDAVFPIELTLGKIRKDMVVVRADDSLAERKTTLYIKQGNDTAFAELERTNDVYEICLAKITVGDTKAKIDLEDIEDTRRDSELAGIVTSLIDIDIQDVLDDITVKKNSYFAQLGISTKEEIDIFIEELQAYCDAAEDVLNENAAMNLFNMINNTKTELNTSIQNLQNTKAEPPRAKNITLSKENWVLNETTEKYEYTYTDNTITENDYIMFDILDDEQLEAMSRAKWETSNGSIKFTNDDQVEIDITLQLVITRVKPEPITPVTPTEPVEGEQEQEVTQ